MQKNLMLLLIVSVSLSFSILGDWEIFQSEEGGFQIEMPDLPAISTQAAGSAIGNLELHFFMHEGEVGIDDNIMYMLSYVDYPSEVVHSDLGSDALKTYFEGSVNGAVNNMNGVLKKEEVITVFGYEGRAVEVEYLEGQAVMKMQIILVKNRMYSLQVIALADKRDNPSQLRFFNSFELLQ